MFYNTGISTYIWILSNKKPDERKGWVQLIDASSFWQKMRKQAQGDVGRAHRHITRLFGDFVEAEQAIVLDAAGKELARQILLFGDTPPVAPAGKVKIVPISRVFKNEEFGYTTITVERPLRDGRQHRARRARQAEGQAPARQQPARHRERAAA
jgi:type I restriction enzyme M protein